MTNCISCKSTFHQDCIGKNLLAEGNSGNYTCKKCVPDNGFETIKSTIQKMRQSIHSLVLKQKDFATTIGSVSASMSVLETLGQKVSKNHDNIIKLQNKISELNSKMEYHEIERRKKNVVISGVPFRSSENVIKIVLKLAEVIKVDLKTELIEKCTRFQSKSGGEKPILLYLIQSTQNRLFYQHTS